MASKAILEKKQADVAALAELMKNAASGVIVQYQGITVEDDTKMRADLRKAGVKYSVIKNSITERACEQVGLDGLKQYLKGMVAVAVSENRPHRSREDPEGVRRKGRELCDQGRVP